MRKNISPLFLLIILLIGIFTAYGIATEIPPIDFSNRPLKLWVPYDPKQPEDIYNIKQDFIFIQSDDLKEIEDAKNPTKTKSDDPPANYQLSSAIYYSTVKGDYINISGVYNIEKLNDEWTLIPVISDQVGLATAALDGKPAFMTTFRAGQDLSQFKNASEVSQGYYYLAIKNKGNHVLKTNFSVNVNKDPSVNTKSFSFTLPKIPIVSLLCDVDEKNLDFQVPQAISISAKNFDKGTKLFASLPPIDNVEVKWNPKSNITAKQEKIGPKLPPSITATSYNKIEVGRGSLIGTYKISIDIRHAALDHFDFYVPNDIEIDSVSANDNIELIDPSPTADKNGILPVDLTSAIEGKVDIIIKYRKNFDNASFTTEIPAITLANKNIERENGFVGVVEKTNIETTLIAPDKKQDYIEVDSADLPDILAGMGASVAFKFQKNRETTTKFPFKASIEVKRHEDIKVYEATIDSTFINTVINEEGQIFTKAIFNVKNTRKQFLKVTLPKNAEIWSVYVDNKSVKPAITDETKNIYAIPLSKSIQENNNTQSFPVEVVYNNKSKFFFLLNYLGITNIKAISTELASNKVEWKIFFPQKLVLFPVELFSNVEEDQTSKIYRANLLQKSRFNAPLSGKLEMSDQMKSIESPVNQTFSSTNAPAPMQQQQALGGAEPMPEAAAPLEEAAVQAPPPAKADEYQSFGRKGGDQFFDISSSYRTKKVGKLPIRVLLPDIGNEYNFSQISFKANTNPNVFSLYVNQTLLSYIIIILSIILIILAVKAAKKGNYKTLNFIIPSVLLACLITYFFGWLLLWLIILFGIAAFFKWALSLDQPLKGKVLKIAGITIGVLALLFIIAFLGSIDICFVPIVLTVVALVVLFFVIKFIIKKWPKKKEKKIAKTENQASGENMEGQNND